ncbi:unnamed protein product [Sphagnum balticum]
MTVLPFLPLWVIPAVAAAAMEQQQGKCGAAGTGDVDHTVAAVLLSPAGTNKDAHPDQEADSQEVAASVILQEHGLGNDVSQDAIGGMIFIILYLSWIAVLLFFMS